MNRRELLRGAIVYTLLPDTLRASVTTDAEQRDAAAIYSLLLSQAGRWLDHGERVGFNLATVGARPPLLLTGDDKEPMYSGPLRPSITAPPEFAYILARMAADLAAMASRVPLPPAITVPITCLPMTPEDVRSFEELPKHGATYNVISPPTKSAVPDAVVARFSKVTGIVSYSGIAFSPDQSLALLAIARHSRSSSSVSYAVLGKAKSTWHELDWETTTVSTVS